MLVLSLMCRSLLGIVLRNNVRCLSVDSVNLRRQREITLALPFGIARNQLVALGRLVRRQQWRLLVLAGRLAGKCGHADDANLGLERSLLITINVNG